VLQKISIATFTIGLVVFAVAQSSPRFQPMEISYLVTHTMPDGEVHGPFRETMKVDAERKIVGTKNRLDADMDNRFRSAKFLREHPDFTGERGNVAGFETYVLRATLADGTVREEHLSPRIGVIPLKSITHYPNGLTTVREAEWVKFGR
jgi:hypothetical protein